MNRARWVLVRWANVAALHRLSQLDALQQTLPSCDRAQAAHRPGPVLNRDVRALDWLGRQRSLTVQSRAAMLGVWKVLPNGSQVRPVLVSNDLAGNDSSAFDRLLEKRFGAF